MCFLVASGPGRNRLKLSVKKVQGATAAVTGGDRSNRDLAGQVGMKLDRAF
jgi:hypothetical protein